MAALGLLILAIAGLVATVAGLANSGSDHLAGTFSVLGYDTTVSTGRLFLYGAVVGAIGTLGLNMLLAGLGRGFKNKVKSRRQLKAEHKKVETMEEEKQRLSEQLAAERSAHANTDEPGIDLSDTNAESGRHFTERR